MSESEDRRPKVSIIGDDHPGLGPLYAGQTTMYERFEKAGWTGATGPTGPIQDHWPVHVYPENWEDALVDFNYDGQGKSQQQEAYDSVRMLAIVIVLSWAVLAVLAVGLLVWLW
jgi:hypothetical protein